MPALEKDIGTRLMLHFTFDVVGVHPIDGRATVDNQRSNMALLRLGARKEGMPRAACVCEGTYVDQHLWAIVGGLERVRPGSVGSVPRD